MLAASLAGKPVETGIELNIGDVTFTEVGGDGWYGMGVETRSPSFAYDSFITPDTSLQVESFELSGKQVRIGVTD